MSASDGGADLSIAVPFRRFGSRIDLVEQCTKRPTPAAAAAFSITSVPR